MRATERGAVPGPGHRAGGAGPAGEARTLAARARLDREQGRLDDARSRIEAALGIVESLRAGMSSPDLRAAFQASKQNLYQLDVDVLMDLDRARPGTGFAGRALAAAERAKARSFLELRAPTWWC